MKINRQLRKDVLGVYGYVELKNKPIALQTPRDGIDRYHFSPVIFHPEVDMLCVATNRCPMKYRTLKDTLEQCKALHRLRSIAIHSFENLSILQAFPRLELVFFNIRHAILEPYQDEICRFNVAECDCSAGWITKEGMVILDSDNYRQRIQEVAARGTRRIAPHVENVEQYFR